MNRNFLLLNTGIVATSLLLACSKPAPTGPPPGGPIAVNISEAQQRDAVYFDIYPGNVVAFNQVDLRAQVNGYVSKVLFTEGQSVKKGQKLYEIEQTRYLAAYNQASASLGVAQSNLEKTRKDSERYNQLAKEDAVAKQRVDYALADFQNAKQQLAAAQAQLSNAQNDLHHSSIYAPFDGTIGISQAKAGAYVTAGQTLLNTVSTDDPMSVDFVVSEKEIPRFMNLNNKTVVKGDSTFTIGFADKSVYKYPGKVQFFDRAVDPQTGTFKIRLQFPNPERMLRAGMSCDVRVMNNSGKKSIVVPFRAVTEQMGEFFVYVVERDTARQHKITIGPAIGADVIIFNGLEAGEKIVTDGIQRLKDGAPVTQGDPQQMQGKTSTPSSPAK